LGITKLRQSQNSSQPERVSATGIDHSPPAPFAVKPSILNVRRWMFTPFSDYGGTTPRAPQRVTVASPGGPAMQLLRRTQPVADFVLVRPH
jgi:hypothetical protein